MTQVVPVQVRPPVPYTKNPQAERLSGFFIDIYLKIYASPAAGLESVREDGIYLNTFNNIGSIGCQALTLYRKF